jgi:proteasome assembly chaperone (PAC2) family protein
LERMSAFEWIARPKLRDPIALLAFSGWGDAGDASSDAARFLVSEFEAETIGRFDSDPFIDFQVNRPVVSVDSDGVRSITWPTTEILVVHLPERDVVAVIGEEPNFNWKRFVNELCSILVELGVDKAISLGAFVGQVAHTVPVPVVGSSSSPRMIADHGLLPSRYEGPTGIVGVVTQALGNHGIDCISLWAAVPHYLSNQPYPPAVEALVRKVSEIAEFSLDYDRLRRRSAAFRRRIEAAIDESDELADYVRQLEIEGMDDEDSGEDLVDEIERYLRDI